MRETRLSGSEGGAGQLNAPSLPLSSSHRHEREPTPAASLDATHEHVPLLPPGSIPRPQDATKPGGIEFRPGFAETGFALSRGGAAWAPALSAPGPSTSHRAHAQHFVVA
jgi:hypothetical protein